MREHGKEVEPSILYQAKWFIISGSIPVSRRNEVLAREICHNVRLLAKVAGS